MVSLKIGLQLGHSHPNIALLGLVLSFRPSIPGRRCVRCVCSKVASLCGVVCSAACLTGWKERSRFSVSLIICIVRLVCDWCFVVGVRVCLGTTIVVFVICSTICIVLDLVFLSFELTVLISIVTWLFAMVACWSGLFRVLLCVLLHHSI